jgi:dihydrofolate reductase
MRELTYLVATSIDGFIAAPGGDITPLLVEGAHLEALIEHYPETFPAQLREPLGITASNQVFDTVIMGANTYRIPGAAPSPYPHLRQIVVTSDRSGIPDDITVWSDDVAARVKALKQEDGGSVWLCGGGRLAASLMPHLDRLLLKVSPVILGAGVPLFGRAIVGRPAFHPVGSELFTNGVLIHDYRPRKTHRDSTDTSQPAAAPRTPAPEKQPSS